jgi:hypothetical protein
VTWKDVMQTLFSSEDKRKNFTISEFAIQAGYPRTTIYTYIKRGWLSAFRAGKGKGSKYRIHRRDGEIWWANMHQ